MSFTVLGASGVIGSHLVQTLQSQGENVYAPKRMNNSTDYIKEILEYNHGHIIYCIGLTADFRKYLSETVDAHVCLLRKILKNGNFNSLTYLSSTRVYQNLEKTKETECLLVNPLSSNDLYNLSKLMGESLCINSAKNVRVVRISNVYGKSLRMDNFLSLVMKEAASKGKVTFHTAKESSKDYIALDDIVFWLLHIAVDGSQKIYNLASGYNISNSDISRWLKTNGIKVNFVSKSPIWTFPPINVDRVSKEFGAARCNLQNDFKELLGFYQNNIQLKGDT